MNDKLLLGTYTRKESKGIYSIELDTDKGQLKNLELREENTSPTYLDLSFNGDRVYSIINEGDQGGIGSYLRDEDGALTAVDSIVKEGSAPCYVALDQKRNLVYSANYHTGEILTYKTNGEGKLELADSDQHEGNSVHENQAGPHAHYINLTPDEKYLVSCDLGTDEVITYTVTDEGKLDHVQTLNVQAGTGPRHLTFHPNAETAYLFGELSSEILVLSYNRNDGSFEVKQTISTLPKDFNGDNSGAAIRISKDGAHLYASNRGHNSIVAYDVNEDGTLSVIDWFLTDGDGPRDFNLNPDDSYLVVGHQHTPNLTLFERDPASGKLEQLQNDVYAPEVVCIEFTK